MIIEGKRLKNFQVYKVSGSDEYIYAWLDTYSVGPTGSWIVEICGPLVENGRFPNSHSCATRDYLSRECYPRSFKQLPEDIQEHLLGYLSG